MTDLFLPQREDAPRLVRNFTFSAMDVAKTYLRM
jgi:hypothetical protein